MLPADKLRLNGLFIAKGKARSLYVHIEISILVQRYDGKMIRFEKYDVSVFVVMGGVVRSRVAWNWITNK